MVPDSVPMSAVTFASFRPFEFRETMQTFRLPKTASLTGAERVYETIANNPCFLVSIHDLGMHYCNEPAQ